MAPSPTGSIHIGNARTALYNYLLARQCEGTFVLRIEDTSRERSTPEFEQAVLDGLGWLGLEWDEGPNAGGDYGPYRQSERLATHKEWLEKLTAAGHTYRCFCTREELAEDRKSAQKEGRAPKYSGKCRDLDAGEVESRLEAGEEAALRFRVEPRQVTFDDLILGQLEEDAGLWGDFIIGRSDGTPVYNFAVVVDDHLMAITDVVRGGDHISNTFKQIVMYEALGLEPPRFGHMPLTLNAKRQKLSKRDGSVAVEEYREQGYLPEAVVNFIALLGWNPGDEREMFTMDELIETFSIERVTKSNAIFDFDRLDWFNGTYIRQMEVAELVRLAKPFIEMAGLTIPDDEYLERAVALEQERVKKLADFPEALRFFLVEEVEPEMKFLVKKKGTTEETAAALSTVFELVQDFGVDDMAVVEENLRAMAEALGWKAGELFMPIRVAITGSKASPPLFDTMRVLGRARVLSRLRDAMRMLAKDAQDAAYGQTD
jgi:glutamyl-tRNA synthetase